VSFVVILQRGEFERRVVGVYRSFKRASADARAWDRVNGWGATVEPLSRLCPGFDPIPAGRRTVILSD